MIQNTISMISDEAFHEAFKPLHIPSAYHHADSWRDKVIFALAELGAGTAPDVSQKLQQLDAGLNPAQVQTEAEAILKALFDKGLIKGTKLQHGTLYNLSKILIENSGSTHPSHDE